MYGSLCGGPLSHWAANPAVWVSFCWFFFFWGGGGLGSDGLGCPFLQMSHFLSFVVLGICVVCPMSVVRCSEPLHLVVPFPSLIACLCIWLFIIWLLFVRGPIP
jgi:hypothetical protein